MDLMETQYSQYYALTAVPPFDPSLGQIIATANTGDPTGAATAAMFPTVYQTAALLQPNYLQNLQSRIALAAALVFFNFFEIVLGLSCFRTFFYEDNFRIFTF